MAIFKTRKHNDDPSLMVVELYSDGGEYIAANCCDVNPPAMLTAILDLMMKHHARTDYCTVEQLIS